MIDMIGRDSAHVYARWFQCLSDPTRIRILNLLASMGRDMKVGEIVEAMGLAQSTVSHHLKLLADVGFVLREEQGAAGLYRVNLRCLERFPSAAEVVMGRLPPYQTPTSQIPAPWRLLDDNTSASPTASEENHAVGG